MLCENFSSLASRVPEILKGALKHTKMEKNHIKKISHLQKS